MLRIPLRQSLSEGRIRHDGFLTVFLLAFFLMVASLAHAQTLPLKHYTTSDGLAHDRVNRIVRDSRGFLWFCTGEGLSRFDGYQFKNYSRDDGLPHRSIHDLLETPDGKYWLATGDGLVLFNPQGFARRWRGFESNTTATDESLMFRVFRPEDVGDTRVFRISQLQIDAAGTVWAATGLGLYRADKIDRNWGLRRVDKEEWRDKDHDFEALLQDDSGALWLAGVGGLYRVLPDGKVQAKFKEISIISLFQDKAGHIWAGARGEGPGGLYQIAYAGLNEPKIVHTFAEKDGLPGRFWFNAVLETADGAVWVGFGSGLSERVKQAGREAPAFRTISNIGVTSLEEDIGGNVWMGTESSGAVRLSRGGFQSFDESDGLKLARILSIVNGAGGEVFIISAPKVIHRFDEGKFTAVSPKGMLISTWGTNQINFQDHTGEWWIAGLDGLQRYPKVNRLEDLANTKPKRLYTVKDGLVDNHIFHLFEDSRGDIWIGTIETNTGNLARWERATDRIHNYTVKDGVLDNNAPTAFGEDRFGNIWIGYYDGGLVRYRDGRFQTFTEKEGLPPGLIRDIYADSAGRIWIASTTSGVVRIDDTNSERPTLVNISTAEGLSSNQAICVAEDNFGRIYIGTGRGVNRLDTRTGRVKVFTTADGLAENFINVCEGDKNGALWFGLLHGLSRFVPEPDAPTAPPPIFISDVIVNGTAFKKLSELGNSVVENLELAADQRQIQINFFALGFSTGETLRYQYKLDNTDWSEPTAQRTVNLSLSPGAYRFLVRAINAEGMISTSPAVVTLSIARPVWQRWWFIAIVAVLVCGGVFVLDRYRVAHARQLNAAREERLRELERVRKRIATDLHDDIGSTLTQISIMSEVAQQRVGNGGSPVTEPLAAIATSSREVVDAMSDIVWAINPERDRAGDLIHRMRRFASDTLTSRNIELHFDASGSAGDRKVGANMRREIFLIFKESVNNIAKHAGSTKVDIQVRFELDKLVLRLVDDGAGFDTSAASDGHGLMSMRERARDLRGELAIESKPGAGTTTALTVPLDQS